MPELGTIEATLLENGRVSLSARFKANSDFALPSFAFELSGNSDFKNDLRTIPGLVEQDQIHGSVPDLKPGASYHVRLLATHRAKQTRSASVSFQTEPVIKHWWESESPAESGWRVSRGWVLSDPTPMVGFIISSLVGLMLNPTDKTGYGFGWKPKVGSGRLRNAGLIFGKTAQTTGCISSRNTKASPLCTTTRPNPSVGNR